MSALTNSLLEKYNFVVLTKEEVVKTGEVECSLIFEFIRSRNKNEIYLCWNLRIYLQTRKIGSECSRQLLFETKESTYGVRLIVDNEIDMTSNTGYSYKINYHKDIINITLTNNT